MLTHPPPHTATLHRGWLAFALLAGLGTSASAAPVNFSRDILPILSDNGFQCHGPDAKARKAGLRLDTEEGALRTANPVIVPGQSGDSELFLRVSGAVPGKVMPPPRTGRK